MPIHQSVQFCVLGLGLPEDRNVRIGVFPKGEEVLIRRFGFGGLALHSIGPAELEMCECPDGFVEHNSAMVENFLELGSGLATSMRRQIGFSSDVDRIQG